MVEEQISSPAALRRGPTCFNCDGAHPLKDCQLPRNQNRIATKRKNMSARVGRYHVEDEQKYGHLVPGRISGNLRHALGLKRYELPLHIYRMRLLGYPPGWLEEARISHSGITLFDSTGNATQDPEEEDGELCEPGSKDKFDIKKILDFPGFNVPASSRYIEEAHLFGLPPMSEQDSKMEMLQMLAPNAMKAYKRKKLTFFPSANEKSLQEGQAEMELDSGDEIAEFPSIPPLPDEEPPPPPPPPPTPPPLPPPEDSPKIFEKSYKPDNAKTSTSPDKKSDKSLKTNKNVSNKKNGKNLAEKEDLNSKSTVKRKENLSNDNTITVKGKACLNNEKHVVKGHESLTNEKKDTVKEIIAKKVLGDSEVDLASSSDDELQVIEVMQVPDIPVPEDDLITIDDEDDDKSQLSSGPDSPSLATLEERKRRLLDALKGDSDISMEMVVLDETFSDSADDAENTENNEKETENKNTNETEREENNASELEPEELTIDVDNDSLVVSEDLVTPETKASDIENSPVVVESVNEEIKNRIEQSSVEDDDKSTQNEKSSISNEEFESTIAEKPSGGNETQKSDKNVSQSLIEKDSSAIKEVNTPDSKAGKVKNTSYGTPVLNVASPFSKLPSDDKFAKDICDVINYENLPNSTGKYKQISSLLKRVKSAVDRIQDS